MTTSAGKIGAHVRSETIERREVRLGPCWLQDSPPDADPTGRAQAELRGRGPLAAAEGHGSDINLSLVPNQPYLFVFGPKPPERLVEMMFSAADAGGRVYVLASPGYGEGPERQQFDRRREARILIRRMDIAVPCSALSLNRGRTACVWCGTRPEALPRWRLALNRQQGEDFFRAILHLFWHESLDEAVTGAGSLRFRVAAERPFDALPPPRSGAVGLIEATTPDSPEAGEVWYHPDAHLPSGPKIPKVIIVPPTSNDHSELARLKHGGADIVWGDLGLPPFSTEAIGGAMELVAQRWRLRIALDTAQSSALTSVALETAKRASMRFGVDVALGSVRGSVLLPGDQKPVMPKENVTMDCGTVQAHTLREVLLAPSPPRPQAPTFALTVTYTWTVQPPRSPGKAKDDPLVLEWAAAGRKFAERIKQLLQRLDDTEKHENILKTTFVSLAGTLLGLGGSRQRLKSDVAALSRETLSTQGPDGARSLLERLVQCESQVERLMADFAEEQRKAEEARERHKQQEEFDDTRRRAEQKLAECEPELKDVQARLKEIEVSLGELAKQPAQGGQAEKDAQAKRASMQDERRKLEKREEALVNDVKRLQSTLLHEFVFRPSKQVPAARVGGGCFIPTASEKSIAQVPAMALPTVGKLLSHDGKRYLAIVDWRDLDAGEQEAKRLNAQLTTMGGTE